MLQAKRAGKTVLLSSHMLSEIELICDRIAIVHRGRVVKLGRTADLLESRSESEIVARGLAPDALPGAAVNGDGDAVTLTVRTATVRSAIERIWHLGGEVVRVNPVRRSLENIFVELTAEPGANGQAASNAAVDDELKRAGTP
jgi:ABC-2 type transport system ATP-binding protein